MNNNEKVLIWSNFIGTVELIYDELNNNYECEKIIGTTHPEHNSEHSLSRKSIAEKFNDPDDNLKIIIANPAACAESISLHKACNKAIYYDLSYNCAHYLQSLDRIHRVGGSESKPSYYYFLQYKNTIDQDIKDNLDKKAKKMSAIIDNNDIGIIDNVDDELDAYQRLFNC